MSQVDIKSETTTEILKDGKSQNISRVRKLMLWLLILLFLVLLVPFCIFRFSIHQRQARIEHLGGKLAIGPPALYHEIIYPKYHRDKYPDFIQKAVKSDFGHWVFSQFPDGWSIDLRGISNPNDVEAALRAASYFENVREITLYRSGATDDHLKIVASEFPNLVRLKINETAITDVGISHMRDHPTLQQINAQRTLITDASIADLASIRRLKELNIAETKITSVQPILDAHSMCRITDQLVTRKNTTDVQKRSKHK